MIGLVLVRNDWGYVIGWQVGWISGLFIDVLTDEINKKNK